MADWNRLAPTNAVNQSQFGLTQWARARLVKMKDPAINRIHLSIFIGFFLLIKIGLMPLIVRMVLRFQARHDEQRHFGTLHDLFGCAAE